MKCIVTGGNGFIGSHVVDKLVGLGYTVCVIDNLSGLADEFHYNNSCNVEYHKLDIANYAAIEKLFSGIDYVFHLAAESRIQPSIENPLLAVQTNVNGTANILQASRVHKVKRVIYSSTSSVYGLNEQYSTHENTPIDCLNPYSTTKYAGEELCKVYSKMYDLDTCIFRYFNVYGERSPTKGMYSPVIGLFLKQNKEEGRLHIMGDGHQRRDFIHVLDVADANIKAMLVETKQAGSVYNIGSGKSHSILEIAKKINSLVEFHPERLGEARNTLAEINKAKDGLLWKPKIELFDWITKNE